MPEAVPEKALMNETRDRMMRTRKRVDNTFLSSGKTMVCFVCLISKDDDDEDIDYEDGEDDEDGIHALINTP
jgi:hypothetical protein